MFCSLKLFVSFILGLPLTHVRIQVPLLSRICPWGYVTRGAGGGGGGLIIMACTGRFRPQGLSYSDFRSVWIEVCERVVKAVIQVWFKGLKGLKDAFNVFQKVERTFSVLWFIHNLKTVHLQQLFNKCINSTYDMYTTVIIVLNLCYRCKHMCL